jgi:hypothetical protein
MLWFHGRNRIPCIQYLRLLAKCLFVLHGTYNLRNNENKLCSVHSIFVFSVRLSAVSWCLFITEEMRTVPSRITCNLKLTLH